MGEGRTENVGYYFRSDPHPNPLPDRGRGLTNQTSLDGNFRLRTLANQGVRGLAGIQYLAGGFDTGDGETSWA